MSSGEIWSSIGDVVVRTSESTCEETDRWGHTREWKIHSEDPPWRSEIRDEMELHGESWDDVVAAAPPPDDALYTALQMSPLGRGTARLLLPRLDDDDRGFTVWTAKRVYFPAVYDGNHWCESVPRNPCDERTEAVGG